MKNSWIDELPLSTQSHSGSTLAQHLSGTATILADWGADDVLVTAGRYHAIYGTHTFHGATVGLERRADVAKALGSRAERLIFLYGHKDPHWFARIASACDNASSNATWLLPTKSENASEWIDSRDVAAIAAICLANIVEQSPRLVLADLDDDQAIRWMQHAKRVLPHLPKGPWWLLTSAEPREEIISLVEALAWRQFPKRSNIVERYERYCESSVGVLLARLEESMIVELPVHSLWQRFDVRSRMATSLCPLIASVALLSRGTQEKRYIPLIEARIAAQAVTAGIAPRSIVTQGPSADDRVVFCEGNDSRQAVPLLLGCIPVDMGMGYHLAWNSGENTRNTSPYPPSAQEPIARRLQEAMEMIATVSEEAIMWIVDAIRVVSVRTDDEGIGSFGSSSWPHFPGLIGLTGICSSAVSTERIASGIVHEAIHNMLYMIEAFHPFTSDVNRMHGVMVQSPWSNRTLPIASYVHACCVWFGLAAFWDAAISLNDIRSTEALSQRARARAGFLSADYRMQLQELEKYVRPDVYQILGKFHQILTAS